MRGGEMVVAPRGVPVPAKGFRGLRANIPFGLGDTAAASPIVDLLDGALTWADDFQGSLADTLNIAFGSTPIAVTQPLSTMKLIGFYAVPAVLGFAAWGIVGAILASSSKGRR